MKVGYPGTQGLELLIPNPGSKNIPTACPTRKQTISPTHPTQPQPKHLSHSQELSRITIINKNNITTRGRNNNTKY